MTQETCKFCGREFSSERIIASHLCRQKQRDKDKNSVASRIALFAFQELYKLTTNGKKLKTFQEFSESKLYVAFIKFARAMLALNPVSLEGYIHYLIKEGIKLKEWTADETYLVFVAKYLMLEPPLDAFERSFLYITEWSAQHDIEFKLFFRRVTTAEAVLMIQGGRISPWVLYLAPSSNSLLDSFTSEQSGMIKDILDPGFWADRLEAKREDTAFIRETLVEIGI